MSEQPITDEPLTEREQEEGERQRFIALARDKHRWSDGDIQVDDDARVAFGDGGGAYVQAWTWVDDPKLLNEDE